MGNSEKMQGPKQPQGLSQELRAEQGSRGLRAPHTDLEGQAWDTPVLEEKQPRWERGGFGGKKSQIFVCGGWEHELQC